MLQYKYTVNFFEDTDGTCPVEDFTEALPDKINKKTYKLLLNLQENGTDLLGSYLKKLSHYPGLYQFQFRYQDKFYRIFCSYSEKTFTCLHMIQKKTAKTPIKDIDKAIERIKIMKGDGR